MFLLKAICLQFLLLKFSLAFIVIDVENSTKVADDAEDRQVNTLTIFQLSLIIFQSFLLSISKSESSIPVCQLLQRCVLQ